MINDAYDSDDKTGKPETIYATSAFAASGLFSVCVGVMGLLGVLLAAGCEQGVAGSLDVVPAWQMVSSGSSTPPLTAITDGDSVDLVRPIQGGHVLFIGAFVRSAVGDKGTIRAELRRGEIESGQPLVSPGSIIVFEERSTQLAALPAGVTPPSDSPDWRQLRADINDLANIPACPNFLPVEIPDHTLYVQITYTDARGNTGFAFRKIVPRCNQTDPTARNNCLCECRANYTIDRCFASSDGGTTD
jgi:hypothetical protein